MISQSTEQLTQSITRKSSIQTYYTIKLLVDKPFVNDAYKAYAYFRWIDDQVDIYIKSDQIRREFIQRQRNIIEATYHQISISDLTSEEQMIVELISSERDPKSRLGSYINNFFKVIEFDVFRKGKLITQGELDWYSQTLGVAVTDCIRHFINHNYEYPSSDKLYSAATAAHILHMLRDYQEDYKDGYINISKQYLEEFGLDYTDMVNPNFINWIKLRVDDAKLKLKQGRDYINQIEPLKAKIAATWYCVRFEWLITVYEKNNYQLKENLTHRNKIISYLRMIYYFGTTVIMHIFNHGR